jgi:hypothetical protein
MDRYGHLFLHLEEDLTKRMDEYYRKALRNPLSPVDRSPSDLGDSEANEDEESKRRDQGNVAEGVGFEPTVSLHPQRFSRPSHSAALAPLRDGPG